MTSSTCPDCGAEQLPEKGILVGALDGRETDCCTLCRARELRFGTALSEREAEIAAHRQLTGASYATIAERIGVSEPAVERHARRMRAKIELAERDGSGPGDRP